MMGGWNWGEYVGLGTAAVLVLKPVRERERERKKEREEAPAAMAKIELKDVAKEEPAGKGGIFGHDVMENFDIDFEDLAQDKHTQGFEIDVHFSVGKQQFLMKGVYEEQAKFVELLDSVEWTLKDVWDRLKVTTDTVDGVMKSVRLQEHTPLGFGEGAKANVLWRGSEEWRKESKTMVEVMGGMNKVKKTKEGRRQKYWWEWQ